MANRKGIKPVAADIALNQDKVPVTRWAAGQSLAGHWEFPGGKLETDETVQDCILRELKEELSISVQAGEVMTQSVYEDAGCTINLIAVYVELIEGDLQLSVHDAFAWVHPLELRHLELAPADIPIAEELINRHG